MLSEARGGGMARVDRLTELEALVPAVAQWGPGVARLADDELPGQTSRLRERLARGEPARSLLPEAFALVREAGRRTVGRPHHDVQVVAGAAMEAGLVAAMKTAAGGALTVTLPAFLGGLAGEGVHVVTLDDDAARRDAADAGAVLRALGLDVGVVAPGKTKEERRDAYAADVTYGSHTELGYDYLRGHLAFSVEGVVQPSRAVALFERADLVLVDKAHEQLWITTNPDRGKVLLARMSVRGYYRLYPKLGGLSVGALPSALAELEHRWGRDVVEVPATVGGGPREPPARSRHGSSRPPTPDRRTLLLDLDEVDDDIAARLHALRAGIVHGDGAHILERLRIAARATSTEETEQAVDARVAELTPEVASRVARAVLLHCIDAAWRGHLADWRDHRRWPFSSDRSAWPHELAAARDRATRAFDALAADAERRSVDDFLRAEVKLREPQ
jgi:preprotein translocase subunit SecA